MENLDTGTQGSTDNQTAPEATDTGTKTGVQSPEQPQSGNGTSGEAGNKPEFTDPNMQARFTQRMTELKKQEAQYKSALQEAEHFRAIKNNPGIVKAIQDWAASKNAPKKAVEFPQITEQEFLEATTNPAKFQKILEDRSRMLAAQMIAEKIGPLEERLGMTVTQMQQREQVSSIQDFASKHPDFWDIDNNGDGPIEEYLKILEPNKNLSTEQKLELAYKLAKSTDVEKQVIDKAHGRVAEKKAASTEKGSGDTTKYQKQDKRTWQEILRDEAAKMTWNS